MRMPSGWAFSILGASACGLGSHGVLAPVFGHACDASIGIAGVCVSLPFLASFGVRRDVGVLLSLIMFALPPGPGILDT
eukprot:6749338-Pyramimonas_sp.AAC.1